MSWYQFWKEATEQLEYEKDPVILKMIQHRITMCMFMLERLE